MAIRVGALIVVAVTLLVAFVAVFGGFSFGERVAYTVEFADSGGLRAGAPVKIAGVRAGRVDSVVFLVDPATRCSEAEGPPVHVRARVSVEARFAEAVRAGSELFITTQGVLGEKYLEIAPGQPGAAPLPAEACIRGVDPARLDKIFARAASIMEKVEGALDGAGGANLGELLSSVQRLVARMDQLVARNEGHIDHVFAQIDDASREGGALLAEVRAGIGGAERVDAIMGDVRRVSRAAAREVRPTLKAARQILGRADDALAEVQTAVEEGKPKVGRILDRLEPTTELARQVMRDGAEITGRLVQGRGLVGRLITDAEIYDDLKELLRNLKRNPWKILWRE